MPANGDLYPTIEHLFRTDDGGETWHPISTPKFDVAYPDGFRYVVAVAVDPQVRGVVYAAAGTGGAFVHSDIIWTELFKSIDGGESWTRIRGTEASSVTSIAIDPAQSSRLYVGTASIPGPGGIFKSVDGGENWFEVSPLLSVNVGFPPVPDAFAILGVDPSDAGVLYASGGSLKLYRSASGGVIWAPNDDGFSNCVQVVLPLAIAPSRSTTLYAGTGSCGIYVSVDSGANWVAKNARVAPILSLAVDPRSDSVAYAGTANGIFKTSNRGDLWFPVGLSAAAINAIAIDPFSPETIYLGTSLGAFRSTTGGASWSFIDDGIQPPSGVLPVPARPASPLRRRP